MTCSVNNNDYHNPASEGKYEPDKNSAQPEIKKVAFQPLADNGQEGVDRGIPPEFHSVSLVLSAELGRVVIRVRDLINYSIGSVLKLERVADEKVTILVNGTPFAHGEIVVINDRFGVRITALVSDDDDENDAAGQGKEV